MNRAGILKYLKWMTAVISIVIVGYVFFQEVNLGRPKLDSIFYDGLAYEIDSNLAMVPQTANYSYQGTEFYIPDSYKQENVEGLIFEDSGNVIEINTDTGIDFNSENYNINGNKDEVYTMIINANSREDDSEKVEIHIWDNVGSSSKNVKQVLITKGNKYVVGNIRDKDLEDKVVDMAYILNSIKGENDGS